MTRLLFIILFFLSKQTFSCECHARDNFFNSSLTSGLIVLARVDSFTSYYLNSKNLPIVMEVSIIETIKGQSKNKKIFIKGQEGKNCLEMLNKFQVGKKYVFALYSCYIDNSLNIDSASFDLSSCGEHWLSFNDHHVKGVIATNMNDHYKKLETIQSSIDGYKGSDDKILGELYKKRQKLYATLVQDMTYNSFKQKLSSWKTKS